MYLKINLSESRYYMRNANGCLRALVKNSIKESFDIIFMENEKNW